MHLTRSHEIHLNNKYFDLCDFLCMTSSQLYNQALYVCRQPLTYFDNLKNNRPVFENQKQLIDDLNQNIDNYNHERRDEYFDNAENNDVMGPARLNYIRPITEKNYSIGKDLVQYHGKSLSNYSILFSQSSQQILHQVFNNIKGYHELRKAFFNKKITHHPKLPNYQEKLNGRNIFYFSSQKIKRHKDYLVLNWKGSGFDKVYKDNKIHENLYELAPKDLKRMTDKHGQFFKLKKNQSIVHKADKVYLKTIYPQFPDKIRIKSDLDVSTIKQIRLIPLNTANNIGYKIEFVHEDKNLTVENILKSSSDEQNKPLFQAYQDLYKTPTEDKSSEALAKHGYFLEYKELKKIHEGNNQLLKSSNIASIDPGLKRLFTMTFYGAKDNNSLINKTKKHQPIIFKDNSIIGFNQWYNKKLEKLQSYTKKEYDQDHSKAMKKLTLHRQHKISNWMHLLSTRIVEDLKNKDIDLLVIGKNIGQKQKINIGKKNNQKFVQLPFNQLWEKIAYKAYKEGILVYYQEESYTSKDNCLSDAMIPIYEKDKIIKAKKAKIIKNEKKELNKEEIVKNNDPIHKIESHKETNQANSSETVDLEQEQAIKKKYQFSGKRCKGMYQTDDGLKVHADVNGSYNIMKKMFQSLNLNVDILNLQSNHQHKTSRKSLHQTFMPQAWSFKALEEIRIDSELNRKRVAPGGAFCYNDRLQTTSEENKEAIEQHV